MAKPSTIKVSVILIDEGDWWAAQCLEYDVAAQAPSLTALQYELQRVLISHVCIAEELGRPPFENLPPAPQKYWDMYTASKARLDIDIVPFRMPNVVDAPEIHPQLRLAEAA